MSRRHLAKDEINNDKNKTKAKKAGKTIAAIVLVGGLTIGSIVTATHLANTISTSKAKSLVANYTVNDCLTLPENVTINQAYDLNYCDGKTLYNAITKSGVKYCEVLDEYYTEDGREIAVLTITGTCTESIPAECVEINGAKVYMAPTGYELNVITDKISSLVKVIGSMIQASWSSNIRINGLNDVSIEITEVHSRPFSDIISETLIVDVPDGAILNYNQECSASFRLVPKE